MSDPQIPAHQAPPSQGPQPVELWPGVEDGKVLSMTLCLTSDDSEVGAVHFGGKGDGTTAWPQDMRSQYWEWNGDWPDEGFYVSNPKTVSQSSMDPPSGISPYHEKSLDKGNHGSQAIGAGSYAIYKDCDASTVEGYLVQRVDSTSNKPYIRVMSVQQNPGDSLLTSYSAAFEYIAAKLDPITYTASTYDGLIQS